MIAPPRKAQVCATDTWCQPCVQLAAWHHCQLILSTFMVTCPRGDWMSCQLCKFLRSRADRPMNGTELFFSGAPNNKVWKPYVVESLSLSSRSGEAPPRGSENEV